MRTLVIDSSWRPISFIKDRRAIVMALNGKVDVVTNWQGEKFVTPSNHLEVPAVVKLKRFVSAKLGPPRFRRKILMCRDNYQCQYCGKQLAWNVATIDHVIPKCRGGKTTWQNCVLACFPCNEKKANRTPVEAGMTLKNTPQEPGQYHFWYAQDYSNCSMWHPQWEFFLGGRK